MFVFVFLSWLFVSVFDLIKKKSRFLTGAGLPCRDLLDGHRALRDAERGVRFRAA
jgi:hypothetical protein